MSTLRERLKKNITSVVLASAILFSAPVPVTTGSPNMFSDYAKNSYPLRTYIEGRNTNTGEHIQGILNYGTAFAVKKGLKSYFITPKHITSMEGKQIPPFIEILNVHYLIGDSPDDMEVHDDYELKLEYESPDSDVSVLSYDVTPWFQPRTGGLQEHVGWIYTVPQKTKPEPGDALFTFGWAEEAPLTFEEGYVSTEPYEMPDGRVFNTTMDIQPGMSGSPVYEYDEDGVKGFVGMAFASNRNWNITYIVTTDEIQRALKKVVDGG